jgi:outer membrane protein OmpA-like peptidoglycan-associated protein
MRRIALLAVLLAACGGKPPRPAELVALDQLRTGADADAAAKVSPDLVGDSDQLRRKADGAYSGGHLDEARRLALMATVQLKTALAQLRQQRARVELGKLDKQLAANAREQAKLDKELTTQQEQIAVLEELARTRAAAAADKSALAGKLDKQQQKADAERRIAAAELALKNADTVDAGRHAADRYKSAADALARAHAQLDKGSFAGAGADADRAAELAGQAFAEAKPKYDEAAAGDAGRMRDDNLTRDAAALPGVTARIERKGDTTRLRLPLIGLFKGDSVILRGDKTALVDALAKLLASYPAYPVEITGFTDNHGKRAKLIERSQARAQALFVALIQRGAEAKRFTVAGRGPDAPIVDNKSRAGRDANNRVEVVFLYH